MLRALYRGLLFVGRLFAGKLFRTDAPAEVVVTHRGTWEVPTRTGTWTYPDA